MTLLLVCGVFGLIKMLNFVSIVTNCNHLHLLTFRVMFISCWCLLELYNNDEIIQLPPELPQEVFSSECSRCSENPEGRAKQASHPKSLAKSRCSKVARKLNSSLCDLSLSSSRSLAVLNLLICLIFFFLNFLFFL